MKNLHKKIPDDIKNYLAVNQASPSGLVWINTDHCKNKCIAVGDSAGFFDLSTSPAYYKVVFKRKTYKVHRIIWYLTTGEDPSDLEIDHIDKNPRNNSFNNLRLVDRYANMSNRSRWGRSRHRGVYLNEAESVYTAYLVHENKRNYLGTFLTEEDAALAWDYAALLLPDSCKILNFPKATSEDRKQALARRVRQRGVIYNDKVLKGVSYDKTRGKYQSYIRIDGKMISLGRYLTAVEAAEVRDAELRKRGITELDLNFS